MNQPSESIKINLNYAFSAMLVVAGIWFTHEFAHWATSELLGYRTGMSLNKTFSLENISPPVWHSMLITAAGPLITIFTATVAYFFLQSGRLWSKWLYLIVATSFYMRFLAGGMNLINFNDEGKISMELGLGVFTIPLLVSAYLLYLLYRSSKDYQLSGRFILFTILLIMLFSSILIVADDMLNIRIL